MKKEYNLLESYEWFGTFWFADKIEDKFSGRLYYKPTGELYLEAITKEEDFYIFSTNGENRSFSHHIFGLVDGVNGIQYITLFKCLVGATHLNVGKASKLKIHIARLVIGRHFPSNFKFANCIVKYKYLDEFILEKNNSSVNIIKQFKLNDNFNVDISPRFSTFWKTDLALNRKENETDEEKEKRMQELEELKVYINNELSKINSSVKNTSKADIYKCKFYKKDGKPDSIAELFKVASIIQQAFSLLMCKYLYAEEQFVTYAVKNQSDNSIYHQAFVFQDINIFNLSEKELKNLPESNNHNGRFCNPFNVEMLSDSEVEEFIKIINDKENNMLIDYLFSFINPKFYSFNKKEKFILAMSLLEREANILAQKGKETEKYDSVIEKYADKEIFDIFLGILQNKDIDTVKVELEGILEQSKTYCLGSVLAFLRSNIVHNEEELKIPNFDRQIKKGMKDEYNNLKSSYQDYWLESRFVLSDITTTLSVLLFKILYSKVIQDKEIFNKAIEKLLTRYFGIILEDRNRKEVINKSIKASIKLTKDLND